MDNRQLKERRFWDKFAKRYDSFVENTVSKTYKSIIESIELELDINHRVLEIGTGTGIIAFSICSRVSTIIATDISPEMIRTALQKQKDLNIQNIDFQLQDSYSMTLPDKSFDVVIATNLFHLLYEPEKPIREVKRVLKDGGVFIAPTFCVGENMRSRIITTLAGLLSGFKIVNRWSINELQTLMTNNGMVINKITTIKGRFPLAYLVMSKQKGV